MENYRIVSQTRNGKSIVMISIILVSMFLVGCTRDNGDNAPSSMEEIHRQQGVPVRVQTVATQLFRQEIDYSIAVSGLRETRVHARVTDQVQNIHARVGQVVQQDQVIIDFPENNVQANFHQAKAAFDLAEQTLERIQRLFEAGGVSQQELDGAETQFRVAEANWDAVQQAVHVRAPFTGTVTDMNVREFQRVTPGDYLFTVSQLNRLHGRIWVSESDIQSINRNSRVSFFWNEVERTARITNIAMSLNRDYNAFAVDVEIDNADHAIRSGVTGTAIVYIYENQNAIVVPMNAIQRDSNGQAYVYVAVNNVAQRRNVVVGNQSELSLEITQGLNVGDRLIVQGLQLVQEGSRLNVQM